MIRVSMRLFIFMLLLPVLGYSQALDRAHIAYTNPLEFGADCNATTLAATITSVGSNKQTLMITKTNRAKTACTWIIATDITFNINTTVWLPTGVSLIPNSGVTITFNGPVKVDDIESIQGAGIYVFNYAENSEASPYISSGCGLTVPSSSVTLPAFACVAGLTMGEKFFNVPQAETSLTLTTTTGINWLLFDISTTRAITGWTRKAGTHYMFQQVTAQPATPAGSIIFGKVTVGSNIITAVEAVGNPFPYTSTVLLGWHNIKQYGAKCDGATNDSGAFQRAVTAAAATSGVVYVPGGICLIGSTTITIPNYVIVKGDTWPKSLSEIQYSGTGSALQYTSGLINSSGYAQVSFEGIVVKATGAAGTVNGAGIEINAGGWSYFQIKKVVVTGTFKYGIIMDATEIASIQDSIIENGINVAGAVNIWVTNGADRTASQAQGYTNGLTISNNQLNGTANGLVDDGGLNHTITGNNFNGHKLSHRVASMKGGYIGNNNYEGLSAGGDASLRFADTSMHTLTSVGGAKGVTITNGNVFTTSTDGGISAVRSTLRFEETAGGVHRGITITGNYFDSYTGRGGAIDVTSLQWSFAGYNWDTGLSASPATAHYSNIHNDTFGNTLLYPSNTLATFTDIARNVYGRSDVSGYYVGGIAVGATGNAVVAQIMSDSVLWNPGSLIAGASEIKSVTVAGAVLTDQCFAGFAETLQGMVLSCYVSAANTVAAVLHNITAGTLDIGTGSTNVRIRLFR